MSGLGSAFGALSTVASVGVSSGIAMVQDDDTKRQVANMTSSVSATASSFWGGLSSGASNFVNSVTEPDDQGSDGLADLQRQFHSQRSANPNSKYGGFGSDSIAGGAAGMGAMGGMGGAGMGGATRGMASAAPTAPAPAMPTSTLGEAMAGPGEDPNGIERLSGESDEQYVMRQTRLRDEAKARMAAKFGGGGMGGVGSNGIGSAPASGGYRGPAAPSSGGFAAAPSSGGLRAPAPSSGNFGGVAAPSSGNLNMGGARTTPQRPAPSSGNAAKVKVASGDDFFANFGT